MQVLEWQNIIEQHGRVVWKTAYRLLAHHEDAADCFQETFLAALEISRKQHIRNLPALLSRLATTRAIDRLRKKIRRTARRTADGNLESIAASAAGPDDCAHAAELGRELRAAIGTLPEQEANAFCLRYLSDMSYRQIAGELNITTTAVGVMLHRAKAKLRRLLTENPIVGNEVAL